MAQPAEKRRKPVIDPSLVIFAALVIITAAICYSRGEAVFDKGLDDSLVMMMQILPKIAGAIILAGFVQVLLPREVVMQLIGERAGFRGLVIATFAGMLTPGGPIVSFPLISALSSMGAAISTLIAYLISWELMGMQRILIWELPLMGVNFTVLRVSVSLFFPLLAGILAQKLVTYLDGKLTERR
ncbi:MAG: permease [Deltaproteobacteria bacterium]|nr:permease [Deltaproteobacteria bacterium]